MSIEWDIIKIKYVYEGYLKNVPYHLLSLEETCHAFLNDDPDGECYFYDNYPCLTDEVKEAYDILVAELRTQIAKLLADPEGYAMPDWVLSYMMGEVISVNSDERDVHDLLRLLHAPNIENEFKASTQIDCLRASQIWIRRLSGDNKIPATPFGAPHVIKQLRLDEAAIV